MAEPSIYREITVREITNEHIQVPSDVEGIRDVAQWIVSTGNGQVADIGPDGFRFRNVYDNGETYRWWWASPGDWITLMYGTNQDREFDMPEDSAYWTRDLSAKDHVSGPALHDGSEEQA